jgi:hypothetical protein
MASANILREVGSSYKNDWCHLLISTQLASNITRSSSSLERRLPLPEFVRISMCLFKRLDRTCAHKFLQEKTQGDEAYRRTTMHQLQLGRIGILMGNILKDVYYPPSVDLDVIRSYMVKCETWFDSLPDYMRLSCLLEGEVPDTEMSSMFIIHLMYLGTIVLLTRKVLVDLARGTRNVEWKSAGVLGDAVGFADACVSAAQQISRIMGLQLTVGLFHKCWLSMYVLLLLSESASLIYPQLQFVQCISHTSLSCGTKKATGLSLLAVF